MSRYLSVTYLFLLLCAYNGLLAGDNKNPAWRANPFEQKLFVENKGQFSATDFSARNGSRNAEIAFVARQKGVDIYFTSSGLVFKHTEWGPEEEENKKKRYCKDNVNDKDFRKNEEGEEKERERLKKKDVFLNLQWTGADPRVQIVGEEKADSYYTYSDVKDRSGKTTIRSDAFKKIIYKNLYPGIDVEYLFPEGKDGLKYNIILHPGSDPSNIKMHYPDAGSATLDKDGSLRIKSMFGEFIDHAPRAFYKNGADIHCVFQMNNNTVTFNMSEDSQPLPVNKTLIIDPWVTIPVFTGSDKAYDVDWDLMGNVYIHGGQYPYQLCKLNNSGVIEWTYTATVFSDSTYQDYGDFAVDRTTGNSYLCEGFNQSGARVVKVDSWGNQVALSVPNIEIGEFWRIAFNSCTYQGVLACGASTNMFYKAAVFDTSLAITPSAAFAPGQYADIAMLAMDDSNCYMVSCDYWTDQFLPGMLVKSPVPSLSPVNYAVNSNHHFIERNSIFYVGGVGQTNGFNGMAAANGYVYTYDGGVLRKWNDSGIPVDSIGISADTFRCGGIAVDACNQVFIGTSGGIQQYDSSLAFITAVATPDTVYDVALGIGGQILACGKGFVSALPFYSACSSDSLLSLSTSSTGSTCAGNDGTASVVISGGTTPYNYIWVPGGQTTSTATGLAPGTYKVIVYGSNGTGCNNNTSAKIDSVTVTAISGFTGQSHQSIPVSCYGESDGSATEMVSGGTPPYTYIWSAGGQTMQTATGLAAGIYYVTVTDSAGCQTKDSVTVTTSANALAATASVSPISCLGPGYITVAVSGGNPPYTFLWSNGDTSQDLSNITVPGSYAVSITDASGCMTTLSRTVDPSSYTAWYITSVAILNACNGNNGSVVIGLENDTTQPLNIYWADGLGNIVPGDSILSGLSPGTYTCFIHDSAGCKDSSFSVTINSGFLTAVVSTDNPSCNGGSDGSAWISSVSGIPPYSYVWSANNQTAATATGLTSGTYTVTVTDSSGCQTVLTSTLTEPPPLNVLVSLSTDTLCTGSSATLTAYGGVIYSWSNGATSNPLTVNPLVTTTYIVTATDLNSCSNTDTVTITVISPVVSIAGACSGDSIRLTAGTGDAYQWNNGAVDSTILVAMTPSAVYTVTVTTACGPFTSSIKVNADSLIQATVSKDTTISKGTTVQLTAAAAAAATFLWSTGQTSSGIIVSPDQSTVYTVTITDAAGCREVDTIRIFVEDFNYYISVPTIFSPNGDGVNDFIRAYGYGVKEYYLVIYNRWGEIVFEDKNASLPAGEVGIERWNGTFLGVPLNAAVFVYTLDAVFKDDAVFSEKGNITLIR